MSPRTPPLRNDRHRLKFRAPALAEPRQPRTSLGFIRTTVVTCRLRSMSVPRSIAILIAVLDASLGHAQVRPDTLQMTCAQASALIRSRGSVVLGTGPDIYDRFVASGGFCSNTQVLIPAWVRAADSPQCFVGYRCLWRNRG